MSIWKVCAGIVLVGIAAGCGDEPTVCTAEAQFAVTVRVHDASTGEPAAFGATLVLRDGQYADSVTGTYPGPNTVSASLLGAAEERPGTYAVTVRKSGYQLWSRQNIVVVRGRCGVEGITLTAQLSRVGSSLGQ